MKPFILIIMIIGSSGRGAVTTQEFTSEATCRSAQEVLGHSGGFYGGSISAICVEK